MSEHAFESFCLVKTCEPNTAARPARRFQGRPSSATSCPNEESKTVSEHAFESGMITWSQRQNASRKGLSVTGRFDLVRSHQFLVVASAPHCRAHVAERVRGRRSRTTETRLPERPRRALSTAKGVAGVRPKRLPVVIEQSYCNQSAMPLSDACGTAHNSPSQRHAAKGLVAMGDAATRRVALASAAA